MDPISFILLAAIGGLFVGALARFVVPGRDPMSIPQTMLVGIAGSLTAGLITHYVFDREGFPGILLSVVCAAVLVFAIRKLRERQLGEGAQGQPSSFGGGTQFGGGGMRVHFMPGCLVGSLIASIALTVLLNLLLRAF